MVFRNCTGPVSNLTDFVPILQKLPGNYMKTRGKKLHEGLVETYGGMILDIDARMKRGEDVPDCLVKTLLNAQEVEQLDHLDMAILCSAFMIGGVETVRPKHSTGRTYINTFLDCFYNAMVLRTYSCLSRDSSKGPRGTGSCGW